MPTEWIWILESDPEALRFYRSGIEADYRIRQFKTLESLSAALGEATDGAPKEGGTDLPALLITELVLPDGSLLNHPMLCERFPAMLGCPFLVISSCRDPEVLRACFAAGALDYLTKPISPAEFRVKIERYLNSTAASTSTSTSSPAPASDSGSASSLEGFPWADPSGILQYLTRKEELIYRTLREARGQSVSRPELQRRVWGEVPPASKSLDVHIFNLRRKLREFGFRIDFEPPRGFRLLSDRDAG